MSAKWQRRKFPALILPEALRRTKKRAETTRQGTSWVSTGWAPRQSLEAQSSPVLWSERAAPPLLVSSQEIRAGSVWPHGGSDKSQSSLS